MVNRIPGIGRLSANKIVQARKFGRLHEYQIRKMGIANNKAKYFMVCADSPAVLGYIQPAIIKSSILQSYSGKYKTKNFQNQLSLF